MSKLTFRVSGKGKKAEGRFPRDWAAEEGIDDILGALHPFGMPREEALRRARRLPEDPDNLELQNTLGGLHWDQGLKEEAAQIWGRAYTRCCTLIPKTFAGQIPWGELDNRPFLRVAYGVLLTHLFAGRVREADEIAKKLLRWSPSDNLGVRWLIPDIAFTAGKLDVALDQYLEIAGELPEAWYQAGRIAFIRQDYVTACTHIRRGILANPYIAEGLTGRTHLDDHFYWHGSNMHAADWAISFLARPPGLWAEPERDFVDWVFNSSAVLRERAAMMELREELSAVREPSVRANLVDRLMAHEASFDPKRSKDMVRLRTNRYGADHWPWERGWELRRPDERTTLT